MVEADGRPGKRGKVESPHSHILLEARWLQAARQTPLASASGLTEHLTEIEIKKPEKSFKRPVEKNQAGSRFGKQFPNGNMRAKIGHDFRYLV
jgi:hypothetical protein